MVFGMKVLLEHVELMFPSKGFDKYLITSFIGFLNDQGSSLLIVRFIHE